jgi:hypothetical protein
MSDANPQQEPSMEEILASIRRIISEDDDPGAKPEEQPAEGAAEDVLELTELAEEPAEEPAEETAEEPAEEPPEPMEETREPEEAPAEDLSIDEVIGDVPQEEELELRETQTAPVQPPPAPPPDGGLISPETAATAAGTLSGLVAAVDRAHGGSALGDGNRTIEDLVKEVMRPMVKDWLDENLPALTERLVRREVERLARHAEDD